MRNAEFSHKKSPAAVATGDKFGIITLQSSLGGFPCSWVTLSLVGGTRFTVKRKILWARLLQ